MADLSESTDQELIDEINRRGAGPRCRCGRWKTYLGVYDSDGNTWRCHGCLRWCPLDQPCHADVLLEIANGADS